MAGVGVVNSADGVYLHHMRPRTRLNRIILVVCLLTLQLQAFAASTLSCRHASEGRVADCPHAIGAGLVASTPVAEVGVDVVRETAPALGECQKCMLDLCLFSALGLLPQPPVIAELARSAPTPGPEPHFYRYALDLWLKPPITAMS